MIQDMQTYKDFNGRSVSIVGRTKDHAEFVYSIQGDWYLRTTGQKLNYNPRTGEHKPFSQQIMSDIDTSKASEPLEL